ncbi:hypothetical protein QSV36_14945 [Pseudomonas sp. BCRC 81390]|uniref:hypothetical protein n=1 Tax=Pseudomonas sp. BCRC 81390 TaxID=3054778 RepID=UPI0025968ADD|nr:hypothetical protein [Pseudomonas sp. BCRC 81390]MDM3886874.1 hypothetical protein [Pseudomonas sp. BCRC 81390]
MQEELSNELQDTPTADQLENAPPQVTRSRRNPGVGPVDGMPCEPGYKLVGDECVLANIDFE